MSDEVKLPEPALWTGDTQSYSEAQIRAYGEACRKDEREKYLKRMKNLSGDVVQEVAELPDRNSPDDQPDMMLVTHEELALIINGNLGLKL